MKKLLRFLILIAAVARGLTASADVVNVAENGTPANSSALYSTWNINMMIDGNTAAVFHMNTAPDLGANYTLNLGKDYVIKEIRIYPRQDGCCPERLKQIHVSVNKDNAGSIGAEVWGMDLFTDGSNAGSGAGLVVKVPLPAPATGQWVEIKALANPVPDYSLQMTELEVYADVPASEVNRALNALVTANQPVYQGQQPSALVNGNRADVVHGAAGLTNGFAFDINLGTTVNLSRIVLWPRQDGCCPERLTNFRVSVHNDNAGKIGDSVWSTDLHTDATNPPSDPGTKEVLTASMNAAGTFKGQWIRIESLDNPPPDYALQLSEVEAFGEVVGSANLLLSSQPQDAIAGLGQTASFSVGASAPGGDATKITYQWQNNNTNIVGATNATYTTATLSGPEDKSQFHAIVSYPGLPSQTSSNATLRIDLAYHAKATNNSPLWAGGGWLIDKLVDGDRAGVFHMDVAPAAGAAYDVNLGDEIKFDEIDIWPRQDGCCPERLTNFRVSVHKDNNGKIGDSVWSADLFTDGSNPGSTAGTVVRLLGNLDAAGTFQGQWIRIESLDAQPPDYALQMTELVAYGAYVSTLTTLTITQNPTDVAAGLGATATLSASTKLVNGDATQIRYQWQKNQTDIAGANAATYVTPPITSADDKSKYRLVVSYPGLATQTSSEATLRVNYAYHAKAYNSFPLWAPGNWNISQLVNGNRTDVFHMDTSPDLGANYQVDLGATVPMEEIDIWARQDGCCAGRLTNFRVSIHKDNGGAIGDPVWSADFFTDGSDPGSTPGSVVRIKATNDPAGTFAGQWIEIQTLENPVQDYALQMTELEVFGQPPAAAIPNITVAHAGTKLRLTWAQGALQTATVVGGPYTPVQNAVSPYDVTPSDTTRFYQAK